jgi:hypothetical protein
MSRVGLYLRDSDNNHDRIMHCHHEDCFEWGCHTPNVRHTEGPWVTQCQNHITNDGRSVSQSWRRAPIGTHEQILIVIKTAAILFVMGRPPCRQDGSVLWQVTVFLCVKRYTRAVWKVCGLSAVRCYAEGNITVVNCCQSTNFSNGPRSCSAILKRVLLKRL